MKRLLRAWRAHGTVSSGFGLLVLACVFLAVAGPRADLALRTRALQQSLAAATPLARSVYGTINDTGLAVDLGAQPSASSLAATGARLRSKLAQYHLPLAGTADDWSGFGGLPFVLSGLSRARFGLLPPQFELVYRQPLDSYATLVAGRMPATASLSGNHGTFEIAVTTATAARFGLRPGSTLRAQGATGITLRVSGIIRPLQADTAFWTADPALARPGQTGKPGPPGTGTLPDWSGAGLVGAAELPAMEQLLDRASLTASWDFPLATGSVTADDAQALSGDLTRAVSLGGVFAPGVVAPAVLSSGVSAVLTGFIPADESASSVLSLLAVSLAVIAVVVVLLGGQLVARQRRAELTVLQARGASRSQVILLALRAAAVPGIPGAAAGAGLAVALTPGYPDSLSWWLGGVALLAALAGGPVLASREHRPPGTRRMARRRADGPGMATARRAAWRRAAAEVTLIAFAVAGIVVLRQSSGGLYASLAPVLVALPVAIVVMRCYPLAVRGLLRLARLRPGVAAFAGMARAAQSSPGTVVPGFALVLALAVAAFGIMVRDAVSDSQAAVSWQQTGADALIDARLAYQAPDAAFVRALSAVPGVRHVALVSLTSASAPIQVPLPVAIVQPAQYAALAAGTPLSEFPVGELASPGSGAGSGKGAGSGGSPGSGGGAVPALATPAAVAALGQNRTVTVGLRTLNIDIKDEISGLPGISGGTPTAPNGAVGTRGGQAGGVLLVLPASALGAGADGSGGQPPAGGTVSAIAPNVALVTGPDIDAARLEAVVRRDLPGAAVMLRATALDSLANSPLPRDEYLAVAAGAGAAAGLTLLTALIAIAGTARSRRLTLARLRVMGVSTRQARGIELSETLPLVVATAAGGVVCAWALGPLIGPALNLSAFTGGAAAVPVGARWAPLGATAAGLVVLTLLALAVEAMTSRNEEEQR